MQSSQGYYEQAKALYQAGSLDQALRVVAEGLERFSDEGRLWQLRGIIYYARRQFPEATHALETATMLAPLSPAAQIALASCYLISGQLDLARSICRHLAAMPNLPSDLLPNLAAGLSRVGEPELALDVHRERARRDPASHHALFAVAHYMDRLGRLPAEILPTMRKAFELAPERTPYRIALALLLRRHGDQQAAYDLLVAVPVGELIGCCRDEDLAGMVKIFAEADDRDRGEVCRQRLAQIARQRSQG